MTAVMTIEWPSESRPSRNVSFVTRHVVAPEPYQAGDAAGQHSPEVWRESNRDLEALLRAWSRLRASP